MSEDNSEELLTGREGVEASQGYTQMPAIEQPADELDTELSTYKHLTRPEEPVVDIEREYHDPATGKPRDKTEAVPLERVADDLAAARRQERQDLEAARNRELDEALKAHEDGQPPQQPAQDQQPTSVDEIQPEQTEADLDAARAQHDAAWAEADAQISKMLENPVVRERVEAEFNQVRQQAKTEVDSAWQQVEVAKAGYVQHANNLTGQLNALILSNFPELQSVAGDPQRLAGAVELLKQTNPQRAQQLQDFALRASTVAGQLEQQGNAHRQAQAAQNEAALTEYTNREIQRYEHWTAREVGDMKAVRENLAPVLLKHYGIDAQQLKAIHDGKVQIDGARLLRSAEFQALATDAIRFRLAQQGVTQARSNPVKPVQRPGTAEARSDNTEYASLERSFRGKDLSAKQAADLLIAHRARR